MMNVKELIRELEKMPGDAKVLVHVKELGGFQRVEVVKTMDGKGFGGEEFGKTVVVLDKKPFIPKKKPQEELCPGCNVAYCQGRYTTGQCE